MRHLLIGYELEFFGDIGPAELGVIIAGAFITSSIHGATGVAGGFLMAAVLASVIGVKPVVPVISVALVISHASRALLNMRDFNKIAFFSIVLPAVPFVILGALLYGRLSSPAIAIILGVVILSSVPLRRWAKRQQITTTRPVLSMAGAAYGGLSGVSVGPGMLLAPFLLGFGLSRREFVATLATIALATNLSRIPVFGGSGLLESQYLLLGVVVGLVTIPGNWVGRTVLRRMTNAGHAIAVDVVTIVGALNFFWLALR